MVSAEKRKLTARQVKGRSQPQRAGINHAEKSSILFITEIILILLLVQKSTIKAKESLRQDHLALLMHPTQNNQRLR